MIYAFILEHLRDLVQLLFLFFKTGLGKAVSDSWIVGHWEGTIFAKCKGFFGRNDGARKYKNGDPKQGEAFPLSTTLFVAFTDIWHSGNLITKLAHAGLMYTCCMLPQGPDWAIYVALSYFILPTVVFHIFYTFIFSQKFWANVKEITNRKSL
jgi:hypothetical protein